MSDQSLPYVIHSDEECERLELQARLANIEGHLRHLPIAGAHRVLDVGCGSGSMSRLIARSFPEVEVVGVDVREQYLDYARAPRPGRRPPQSHIRTRRRVCSSICGCEALIWCGANIFCNGCGSRKPRWPSSSGSPSPAGMSCPVDYVGCVVEHFPIDPELERKIREIMALLVDVNIGRKVPAYMIALGFRHVQVDIETDTLFTVIGRIDARPAAEFGDPISGHAAASDQDLGNGSERYSARRSFPRPLRRSGDVQLHQLAFHPRPRVRSRPSATALRFKLHCRQL